MDEENNLVSSSTHLLLHQETNNNNNKEIIPRGLQQPPSLSWIGGGEYVKSVVYAGLDAIVTSFALISSISAGHLSSVDVLVLGVANLVADGISMGFGDFVSSSTEKEMAAKERAVTDWKVTSNGRPHQLEELVLKYQELGMSHEDATIVVNVFSKYKDVLVDEKMAVQKRILPADQEEKPWKNGAATFTAFLIFGSAPLLSFIILIPFTNNQSIKFSGACILSALALALLGIAKAKIAGQGYAISVLTTLLNGAIAAASAYFIGWALRNIAGLEK